VKKAKILEEMFPGKDSKYYCDAVEICGNVSIEELIGNFC